MRRLLLLAAAAVAAAAAPSAQRVTLDEIQTLSTSDADGAPLADAVTLVGPPTSQDATDRPYLFAAGYGDRVATYVRDAQTGALSLAGTYADAANDQLGTLTDGAVLPGGSAHFVAYRQAGGVTYVSTRVEAQDMSGGAVYEVRGGASSITTEPFPSQIAFFADGSMLIASEGSGQAPRRLTQYALRDNQWVQTSQVDLPGGSRRARELATSGGMIVLAESAFLSDPDSAMVSVYGVTQDGLARLDSLKRGDVPGLDLVTAATFGPDGRTLYVAGYEDDPDGDGDPSDAQRALLVFEVSPPNGTLTHHSTLLAGDAVGPSYREAYSLAASSDGRYLVVGGSDTNAGQALHAFAVDGDGIVFAGSTEGPGGNFSQTSGLVAWPGGDTVHALDAVSTARLATFGVAFSGVAAEGSPEAGARLVVWPNPAPSAATVALDVAEPGPLRVTIHDALGREVAVLHDGPTGAGPLRLDVEAGRLAPGAYVVRATGAARATGRLTVIR